MTTQSEIHGKWTITFNPKPIPDRRFDWDFVHDEYTGDEDHRSGQAASAAEAKALIYAIEQDMGV